MQNRMPIIAALIAGVLAVVFLNLYIGGIEDSLRPSMTSVVMTAKSLTAGAVLDAKDIIEQRRPTDALPKTAVRWDERSQFLGQRLDLNIAAGDYVLANYFGGLTSAAQRLSERIDAKNNLRALTIPVTAETSLERSLRAGDRIDLMLTYTKTDASNPAAAKPGAPGQFSAKIVTTPLLEKVYVLATGAFGNAVSNQYSTITIQVTSEEAELITWARKLGELTVLLRNPKDVASTNRSYMIGDASLLGDLGKQAIRPEDVIAASKSSDADKR